MYTSIHIGTSRFPREGKIFKGANGPLPPSTETPMIMTLSIYLEAVFVSTSGEDSWLCASDHLPPVGRVGKDR